MEIQLSNCRFGCLTPNKKSKWVREARNEGRGGGHGDHGFRCGGCLGHILFCSYVTNHESFCRQSRVSFTFKVFAHTT
uniref:Uncharacterized protein n=1 Tax=Helianthus annuus TaxID=4232 RepID=A0A251T8F0_HELAN